MHVLIDKRNLQLRGVFLNKKDVIIHNDKVVTPKHIILDLNDKTAILNSYNGKIPDTWKKYEYYYDRTDDKFKRTINNRGQKIFINE